MTTGFFQKARRDENGTFIVLMALGLLGIFGMAALSIDIGHVYQQKRDIQSATDFASLAGAALLTNQPQSRAAITTAAQTIALSNGLTIAEIGAAAAYDGKIEVGTWNTTSQTFTPDGSASDTTSLTWNAVRVPAKRSVGLFFGKMTVGPGNGLAAMSPVVHSVAMVTNAGSAFGGNGAGLIPFVLYTAQASNAYFTTYSFSKGDVGTGNFGKADFGGDWGNNMTAGCNCTVSVGQSVGSDTGNADIKASWIARWQSNPYVVFPISDPHGPGNSNHGEVITGFILAKITDVSGNGNGNWTVTVENIPGTIGGSVGGGLGLPYAQLRALVQ